APARSSHRRECAPSDERLWMPPILRIYLITVTWAGAALMAAALPGSADAQAAETPVCPARALAPLAATHGAWHVTWLDRVTPEQYVTSQARATIEPTAGGCGLLERFEGTRSGRVFQSV